MKTMWKKNLLHLFFQMKEMRRLILFIKRRSWKSFQGGNAGFLFQTEEIKGSCCWGNTEEKMLRGRKEDEDGYGREETDILVTSARPRWDHMHRWEGGGGLETRSVGKMEADNEEHPDTVREEEGLLTTDRCSHPADLLFLASDLQLGLLMNELIDLISCFQSVQSFYKI